MKRCLLIFMFLFLGSAQAENDADATQKALTMIEGFAKSMCANPEYKVSVTTAIAGAKAKADVSNLIKKLVDANVEVGAEVKRETSDGLLHKDLLEATKNATSCRLTIFNSLVDRILPKVGIVNPPPSPSHPRIQGNNGNQLIQQPVSLSFAPSVLLGATKADFIARVGQNLKWDISSDAHPLEYTTIKVLIGTYDAEIAVFFDAGKSFLAKTEFKLSSEHYKTERTYQVVYEKFPGLSYETYNKSCANLRDEVFGILTEKQNLISESMESKTIDETLALESSIKDRPLRIEVAKRVFRNAKFAGTKEYIPVSYKWFDRRWHYSYDQSGPTGAIYVDNKYAESNTCYLQLYAKQDN